jgi:hypothetical protein
MVDLREHYYEPSGFIKTELPSQLCNCQHFEQGLAALDLFNQVRYSRYSVYIMYVWGQTFRQSLLGHGNLLLPPRDYPRPQPHAKIVDISCSNLAIGLVSGCMKVYY